MLHASRSCDFVVPASQQISKIRYLFTYLNMNVGLWQQGAPGRAGERGSDGEKGATVSLWRRNLFQTSLWLCVLELFVNKRVVELSIICGCITELKKCRWLLKSWSLLFRIFVQYVCCIDSTGLQDLRLKNRFKLALPIFLISCRRSKASGVELVCGKLGLRKAWSVSHSTLKCVTREPCKCPRVFYDDINFKLQEQTAKK